MHKLSKQSIAIIVAIVGLVILSLFFKSRGEKVENVATAPISTSDVPQIRPAPVESNNVVKIDTTPVREYQVVKESKPGLVAVEVDGQRSTALTQQLTYFRCGKKKCVRFPDGRTVEITPKLKQSLPRNLNYQIDYHHNRMVRGRK